MNSGEKSEKSNNRRARRSNRPLIIVAAGVVLLVVAILGIVLANRAPSCSDSEELKDGRCIAKREVDIYTYEHDYKDKGNQRLKLTVEVPKSLGYTRKDNDVKIELYRESDRSTISIYSLFTSVNSIAMKESDYSKKVWKDYKYTENDDGSRVVEVNKIRSDGSIYGVEWSKAYRNYFDSYWGGARVTAMASGLDQGKDSSFGGKEYKTFNPRDTFESEDFQYMLNSIKIELSSLTAPAAD